EFALWVQTPVDVAYIVAMRGFRYNPPISPKFTRRTAIRRSITSTARVGIGEDSHRLVAGGPLLLGGVAIPHDRQLAGHSDADALLHAVTDALLGAAALGDIGEF